MEIKIICISSLFLLLFFFACKKKPNNYKMSLERCQTHWQLGIKDTTLIVKVGNLYIKYHIQGDSTYNLEWGNETVKNVSKEKFEVLGNGILNFIDSDEKAIILGQNCGSSCIYYVILPLLQNSKEKKYLFAKTYDLEKTMVAYIPEENDIFVRVENYITGQYMDIKEENICMAVYRGDCIDSIYFSDETIVIKWQGNEWLNDKSDPKEKKIKIMMSN